MNPELGARESSIFLKSGELVMSGLFGLILTTSNAVGGLFLSIIIGWKIAWQKTKRVRWWRVFFGGPLIAFALGFAYYAIWIDGSDMWSHRKNDYFVFCFITAPFLAAIAVVILEALKRIIEKRREGNKV